MSDQAGEVEFDHAHCTTCGAVVRKAQEELHRRWHLRLRESVGAIAAALLAVENVPRRLGRSPVRY